MTLIGCVLPVLLAASPVNGGGGARLLLADLHLDQISMNAEPRLRVVDLSLPTSRPREGILAAAGADKDEAPSGQDEAGKQPKNPPRRPGAAPKPGSLEFDLLGTPPESRQVDEHALRVRRDMLNWHQGVGLGMFALQLATTVVGQLNYDDKFGGDNTGKYVQPHAILAYSTLGAFVAAGTLALLAPKPHEPHEGFDRVSLHKLAMFSAAAGMLAQGVLGVWTQSREGYLNQQSIGTAHLVIGYVTLAAVATGIGALVF